MGSGPHGLSGEPVPKRVTLVDVIGNALVEILHLLMVVGYVSGGIVIPIFAMICRHVILIRDRNYLHYQQPH